MSIWNASLETANRWYGISWWGLLSAGVITALAAAFTVGFLFVQFWSSSIRDEYADKDRRQQKLDTANATDRANGAQLALEQYKAPRELSKAQFATLVSELRPFSGQSVLVGSYKDVAESSTFAKQLQEALVAAGWKLADPYFPGLAAGTAGIFVRTDVRNPNAPHTAAEAIAKALTGFGITAVAPHEDIPDALFLFGGDRKDQVSVEVGTKF